MSKRFFDTEHAILRQHVRRFVQEELSPHIDEWDRAGGVPREAFQRMGEVGLLGMRYPVEYGGQGGDYFSAVVLAEELARCGGGGLPMSVAVHNEMATPPILEFGTKEQKQQYLVPAFKGEKIASLGITEPNAGSDVSAIRTSAKREGGQWVINGTKTFITNGMQADFVTLVARTRPGKGFEGLSLFLVDRDAPGFLQPRKVRTVGMQCSGTAELVFDDCRVPAEALLGEEGQGFKQIMWELQGERLIGAAGAVAMAEYVLEESLRYAKERKQFGRSIASFQTISHMLADMAIQIEASKQLVYGTAWKFANGQYPVKEISMAKLVTGRMLCWVADRALQIYGGYGYTKEFPIERIWRDARVTRIGGGADEVQLEIIAKELGLH